MEVSVKRHQFLEYGEHNGHLYGTKLDSIHSIIDDGLTCILVIMFYRYMYSLIKHASTLRAV